MRVSIESVGFADILVDVTSASDEEADVERQKVYRQLQELEFGTALQSEAITRSVNVGLEAALLALEQLLRRPGAGAPRPPDLTFVETSFFPERMRMGDVIRDFVAVRVTTAEADANERWKGAARTYETLYQELHEQGRTIYYIPRFFREPMTISMPWSKCVVDRGDEPNAASASDGVDLSGWTRGRQQTWFRVKPLPESTHVARPEQAITQVPEYEAQVRHFHSEFHSRGLPDYSCSYLWCIPLVGGTARKRRDDTQGSHLGGLGAVFAIAAYKDQGPPLLQRDIAQVGRSLSYLLKDAFTPFLYATARQNLDQALKHARRSAVAAVIGRNMSHNIGSHVLANITSDVLKEQPKKGELLFGYLQHRMDFIAQVSTSAPSWCLGMSAGELLLGFVENRLLLDHIVRFAAIGAKQVDFAVALNDESWDRWSRTQLRFADPVPNWLSLRLDVAHGSVGAHAFYSILENLIRNAARHGDPGWLDKIRQGAQAVDPVTGLTDTIRLRFSIHFDDRSDGKEPETKDYIRVRITDHTPTRRTTRMRDHNASPSRDTAELINEYVQAVIVDEQTGELPRVGWGMKEIRIGASFLRLYDTGDDRVRKPPLAEVQWAHTQSKSLEADLGCLQFTIYLPKVKVALLVGAAPRRALDEKRELLTSWKSAGVEGLASLQELERCLDRGDVFPHAFLVVDGADLLDVAPLLQRHSGRLPPRVMFTGTLPDSLTPAERETARALAESVGTIADIHSPDDLEDRLWERWCEQRYRDVAVTFRWSEAPDFAWPTGFSVQSPTTTGRFDAYVPNACVFDHDGDAIHAASEEIRTTRYHQLIKAGEGVAKLVTDSYGRISILNQVREMAACRVAILDERIYARAEQAVPPHEAGGKYSGSWSLGQIWECRGVALLPYEGMLTNLQAFVEGFRSLLPFRDVPADGPACDYLVIHEGLIDSFSRDANELTSQHWARLKSMARHVVIDTGRGVPATAVREMLPWVEYSNLADKVIGRPGDKLGLWRLLTSIRASRNS
ncbi:MAG: hypothetical protein ACRD3G_26570 [Vicinamibacterales bacterium]